MKLILILLFTTSISLHAQVFIDMSEELSNINKTLLIDGNLLRKKHNTSGEIIITGKNMLFKNNSRVILNNVIILLSGDIILEDDAKIYPKFIESFIFCKSSDQWISENIIVKSNFKDFELAKVKHIKKIKGNPNIYIYDLSGKKVYSGPKDKIKDVKLAVGRYDLRVEGKFFKDNLLFY